MGTIRLTGTTTHSPDGQAVVVRSDDHWDHRPPAGTAVVVTFEIQPLTVGELMNFLGQYPSDMRVLIDDSNGWFREVAEVVGPAWVQPTIDERAHWSDADTGYSLPTLMAGATFDSRSL